MQEPRVLSESEVKALENFQNELKRCVQDEFGIYLPSSKIATLVKTNYINYDKIAAAKLQTIDDLYAIQGAILRDILDSIIDLTCEKKLEVDTNKWVTIEYGRNLEDGILEYYAQRIAALYHLNIDKPKDGINIELAMTVYNKLKDKLNPNIFQYNAIGILDLVGDAELTKKCDELAIEHYHNDDAILASIPALQYIEEEEKNKVLDEMQQDKEDEEASAMGLWQEAIEAERETELVTPIEETEENKIVLENPVAEVSVQPEPVQTPVVETPAPVVNTSVEPIAQPVPVIPTVQQEPATPKPVPVVEAPVMQPEPTHTIESPVAKIEEPTFEDVDISQMFAAPPVLDKADDAVIPQVIQPTPVQTAPPLPDTPEVPKEEVKEEKKVEEPLTDAEKERVDEIIADYASGKKITDEEWAILSKAMPELNRDLVNDTNIIEYTVEGNNPTLSFNPKGKGFVSKGLMIYLALIILAVVLVFGFLLFKGLQ